MRIIDPEQCCKNEEGGDPQLFMARGLSLTNLHLPESALIATHVKLESALSCSRRRFGCGFGGSTTKTKENLQGEGQAKSTNTASKPASRYVFPA